MVCSLFVAHCSVVRFSGEKTIIFTLQLGDNKNELVAVHIMTSYCLVTLWYWYIRNILAGHNLN